MTVVCWYDEMSAFEYTEFYVLLQYLMESELSPILPPQDNEVPSEENETPFNILLGFFCAGFEHYLSQPEFRPFTAQDCYNYPLPELSHISAVPLPFVGENWTIADERHTEFIDRGPREYWDTVNGKLRMICNICQKETELNNDQRINYIERRTKEMVIDFARSCGCDEGKLISISGSISERIEERMEEDLEGSDTTNSADNNMSFMRESPESTAFDIQRLVEAMVSVPGTSDDNDVGVSNPTESAFDQFQDSNRCEDMHSPVDIQMRPDPESPNSSPLSSELGDTGYNPTLAFPVTSTPYFPRPVIPVVPIMSPVYPALVSPVYPVYPIAHLFIASPVFPMPMLFSPGYPSPVYPIIPQPYHTFFHQ
ncbi:hypothetical protein B9Z55_015069 [Caenorhabditis nigoni]|uniref:Uncharacterized protein n=1 Tax=Caenorhabditis nigoni TaxID=1611254 RepID=A0A2G5U9A2_9PELO|nr:hypothetical protein B9Z55_015069 [Caenorhabditis nigoni]